jgi:hypothetical protein
MPNNREIPMTSILARCAIAVALTFGAVGASATTVDAFGSGWINSSFEANNAFGGGINNSYAGYSGLQYNNWFEFALPNTVVTDATLSIWNSQYNTTIDPDAVYSLHAPLDYTFAGLVDGPSFGSVTLGLADNGTDHYVSITLNGLGVAYLNSHLGDTVRFGGTTTSYVDPASCSDCVAVFGYTGGSPVAQLAINVGGVPEPTSWAMLITGFGLVGAAARRRRNLVVAA